jgi:hypothetical protein
MSGHQIAMQILMWVSMPATVVGFVATFAAMIFDLTSK